MSRILKAYKTTFHQILKQAGARRVDQGVDWLVREALRLNHDTGISLPEALSLVSDRLTSKLPFTTVHLSQPQTPAGASFFCDSGLGGLARWLRAAGYRALWEPTIADDDLLARAHQIGATVLTTDSMLMERRLLRDKAIPSMWLPPTLSIFEALERVFKAFQLRAGSPRCMSCGGELVQGDKEVLRERIPPKTYRWLNEYFVCRSCGKLFWHGTHWLKIVGRLKHLTAAL